MSMAIGASGLQAIYDVPAPAKLNLFLHVVGRRADGYHLLQSVFVLIDWCDVLHVELRADGRLSRHDLRHDLSPPREPLPADDLCLRAARALQQAGGVALGADISLDKQLPTGAGLGGGSSDAASTLLVLNRLWGLRWPVQRLLPIGLALGADVPFFLGGHNAWVEGVGERLTPIDIPSQWFAVVKPTASVETRSLFARAALARYSDLATIEGFRQSGGSSGSYGESNGPAYGRNDLEAAARDMCGEVGAAGDWLRHRFGNSRMTGSGSAVFATAGVAEQPAVALAEQVPNGWTVKMCRSLLQHPLAGW